MSQPVTMASPTQRTSHRLYYLHNDVDPGRARLPEHIRVQGRGDGHRFDIILHDTSHRIRRDGNSCSFGPTENER